MRGECCGNLVCEATEIFTSCSDCGPFVLGVSLPQVASSSPRNGVMFDVEAIGDISIESLTFYPEVITGTIDLYTVSGGWSGNEGNSNAWTKIIDGGSFGTPNFNPLAETSVGFEVINLSAGSVQGFYIASNR